MKPKFKVGDRIIYQEPNQKPFKGLVIDITTDSVTKSHLFAHRYKVQWLELPKAVPVSYSFKGIEKYSTLMIDAEKIWQEILNEN